MANKPAFKFKLGLITATIWDNDGFYSVDFARSYKDSDGNWKNTTSFAQERRVQLFALSAQ